MSSVRCFNFFALHSLKPYLTFEKKGQEYLGTKISTAGGGKHLYGILSTIFVIKPLVLIE
jgi:hypothetical protein